MTLKIKSTKSFLNLPCAHSQWFDTNPDGTPGHCAGIHGYDRSVHFVFAGEVDDHGWIYPFGDLKPVKEFLEYYFDHVTVLGADDPRLAQLTESAMGPLGMLNNLRLLPHGCSMEMSALFVWERVNAYIYHTTHGRVHVERVEIKEHERNSGIVEVDEQTAHTHAQRMAPFGSFPACEPRAHLAHYPRHVFEPPVHAVNRINDGV